MLKSDNVVTRDSHRFIIECPAKDTAQGREARKKIALIELLSPRWVDLAEKWRAKMRGHPLQPATVLLLGQRNRVLRVLVGTGDGHRKWLLWFVFLHERAKRLHKK